MTPLLTRAEIAELDELFLAAYHAVEHVRQQAEVGRALHAVKLPPRLSESLVAVHCCDVFGAGTRVLERCAPHDLTLRTHRRLNVAVKGSGRHDWAAITAADRLADVLVWVDYRDRLLDSNAPVLLWRIPITRLPGVADRAFLRRIANRRPVALVHPAGR